MDKACIAANEFIKEFIWWKLHIANGVFVNDDEGCENDGK